MTAMAGSLPSQPFSSPLLGTRLKDDCAQALRTTPLLSVQLSRAIAYLSNRFHAHVTVKKPAGIHTIRASSSRPSATMAETRPKLVTSGRHMAGSRVAMSASQALALATSDSSGFGVWSAGALCSPWTPMWQSNHLFVFFLSFRHLLTVSSQKCRPFNFGKNKLKENVYMFVF